MENIIYISPAACAVVAFIAVTWAYFKILRIAVEKQLVDNPDARKLQNRPVPVVGGLAVFFGILSGVLLGASIHAIVGDESSTRLLPIMCMLSVMLYIGAMDDVLGLSPKARLIIEILSMVALVFSSGICIDSLHGTWGVYDFSWWIGVPLTVVTGVGIINAVNMIDGVNGLSSGLCITCCLFFGIYFILTGDTPNAVLAFTTIGALAPFYLHNVFGLKSRMFIGDAGTMVMGALLTWFTICLLNAEHAMVFRSFGLQINPIALVLSILSLPVFDTLRVMGMRIAHHKSPFHPDKTHLHHIFVNVGISHFITSVSEILIDAVVVVILILSAFLGAGFEVQLYVVIAAAMLFVWGTYAVLQYNARNHTAFLHRITNFSIKTHLGRKHWWKKITNYLDRPCVSFVDNELMEGEEGVEVDKMNLKEQDRFKIIRFIKGRAEVLVSDILENSGADSMRVYPILVEEIQKGRITVIKESWLGSPEIVSLNND